MKRSITTKVVVYTSLIVLSVCVVFIYWPDVLFSGRNEKALNVIQSIKGSLGERSYCFAYASDCRENMKVLTKLIDKVNKDPEIQWLIFGGDIVSNCDLAEYRRFMKMTDQLKKPMLLFPGNHEMRGLGQILFRYFYGRTFFSFDFKGDMFLLMDNSNEEYFGAIQRAWASRILEKAKQNQRRFVFFHVPLYDDRTIMKGDGIADNNAKEAKEILKILKEGAVSHIFTSHLHGYHTGQWEGVPYTISAGAGAPLHGHSVETDYYNYLKIRVSGEKYDIEVIKI